MRFSEFKPRSTLLLNQSNQHTINAIRRSIEALKLRLRSERERAMRFKNNHIIKSLNY
jgi:hypothetical protein